MIRPLILAVLALSTAAPAQAGWRHHVSWVRVDRAEFVLSSPSVHWSRSEAADFLRRVAERRAQRRWP